METAILSDKDQYPTEEIIYSHIGKNKTLWQDLFEYIHLNYPDISTEWRYYNDGKSWLLKATRKSKTIFWLSLFEKTFRTTFYFPVRVENLINNSSISVELKEQFNSGKSYSKIKGITISFKNKKDIENVKKLIPIKLSIK